MCRKLVILLGRFVASLTIVACAAGAEANDVCPPSATVEGESAAAVRDLLGGRGIAEPTEGCQGVHARLSAAQGGLEVEVTDPAGRQSRRDVDSPSQAATLIESWARSDLSAALLTPPVLAFTAPAERPVDAEPTTIVREVVRPTHDLGLAVGATIAHSNDGAFWAGAELQGCVRVGRLCVGADARVLRDMEVTKREIHARRMSSDMLLLADLPYRVGKAMITPGLGVGLGWLHNGVPRLHQHAADADRGGMRTTAHLTVSIPLTHHLSFDVGLALDVSPFAQTSTWDSGGVDVPGDPRVFQRGLASLRYGEP
jgi:hypothetical protein